MARWDGLTEINNGDFSYKYVVPTALRQNLRQRNYDRRQRDSDRHQLNSIASDAPIQMRLIGADSSAKASGLDELPGHTNYFIGNDPTQWRANVPNYARVQYSQVYQGIDLTYYGNGRNLEYDFNVAPGGDPSAIDLSFDGVREVEIDGKGDLVLLNRAGEALRLQKPIAYQDLEGGRREIDVNYIALDANAGFRNLPREIVGSLSYGVNPQSAIRNRLVGFRVGAYDQSK